MQSSKHAPLTTATSQQSDAVTEDGDSSINSHHSHDIDASERSLDDADRSRGKTKASNALAAPARPMDPDTRTHKGKTALVTTVLLILGVLAVASGFCAAGFAVSAWYEASLSKAKQSALEAKQAAFEAKHSVLEEARSREQQRIALEEVRRQEQHREFVTLLQKLKAQVVVPESQRIQNRYKTMSSSFLTTSQVPDIAFIDINGRVPKDSADALGAALGLCSSLKSLRIRNGNLGDAGAAVIAGAIRSLQGLESVALPNNGIGYDGAKSLAEAIAKHQGLRHISVSDNHICGIGLSRIVTGITSIPNIQSAHLDGNLWSFWGDPFDGWWPFGWSSGSEVNEITDRLLSRWPHLRLRVRSKCWLCMDRLYTEKGME